MSKRTRRIRYSVAASLDGFIADREGGYAWITDEPAIDFVAYVANIDTLLMGRGTYETAQADPGGLSMFEAMDIYVVSTTLDPDDVPEATLISEDVEAAVRRLKEWPDGVLGGGAPESASAERTEDPVKDIWLFGGGVLFRSLLEAGLVDRVEVAIVPVLLGEGVPVLPGLGPMRSVAGGSGDPSSAAEEAESRPPVAGLRLHSAETFESGMLLLKYDVQRL